MEAEPFYPGTILLHEKSGGHYVVVSLCRIEATGAAAYAYEPIGGGTLWVRPAAEMEDGRFVKINLSPGSSHSDDLP